MIPHNWVVTFTWTVVGSLSEAVSRLREAIAERCSRQPDGIDQAGRWLQEALKISADNNSKMTFLFIIYLLW